MRDRAGAQRAQLYAAAHGPAGPGAHRPDAPGPVRRPELPEAVPLWQHPHHEPLELPGPADAGPAGGRHCGGQYRRGQAQRLRPRRQRPAGGADRALFPAGIRGGGHRGQGGKRRPAGGGLRLRVLHRKPGGGPGGSAAHGGAPDPGGAGAGREKPLHRGRDGPSAPGSPAHRIRQIPELRADLRGAGLHPVPQRHQGPSGGGAVPGGPAAVRGGSIAKSPLRQDRQREAFSAPAGADGPGQDRHRGAVVSRNAPNRPHHPGPRLPRRPGDAGGNLRPHPAHTHLRPLRGPVRPAGGSAQAPGPLPVLGKPPPRPAGAVPPTVRRRVRQ